MKVPVIPTRSGILAGAGAALWLPGRALAQLTQEEVLRSISANVRESANGGRILAILFAAAALLILVLLLAHRRQNRGEKRINHLGKLIREVSKSAGIEPAEVKRLRALAETHELRNPLLPLLCPSVLALREVERKSS